VDTLLPTFFAQSREVTLLVFSWSFHAFLFINGRCLNKLNPIPRVGLLQAECLRDKGKEEEEVAHAVHPSQLPGERYE
jgi:hypothetical protein